MIFVVLTLFPNTLQCFLRESIVHRAIQNGTIAVEIVNIRDYSRDKNGKVDDAPFGGGSGMLMTPDPLFRAIEGTHKRGRVVYLSPAGSPLNQERVRQLSRYEGLTLVCGHYEGIDNRVVEHVVDEEISIGDYILTGGEIAAAVLIDTVTRELDNALGNNRSKLVESFDTSGLLEYEQYTRPALYREYKVPEVLLSGNHREIERWRMKRRLIRTMKRRPDLLAGSSFSEEYKELLREIEKEKGQ